MSVILLKRIAGSLLPAIQKLIAMRIDRKQRYNPDWLAVSTNIRIHRAENRCELCGLSHGALIHREKNQPTTPASPDELAELEILKGEGQIKHWQRLKALRLKQVILTVAHK